MVSAGNKAKCLSSVSHITKTIHHLHHHQLMLFNSWFNPSGYDFFSLKAHKVSPHFEIVLASSGVACFLICSIKMNLASCWKLLFCSLKCWHLKAETCSLASFLWLLRILYVRLWNIGKVSFVLYLRDVLIFFTCLQQKLLSLKRHGEQWPACFGCLVFLCTTLFLRMRMPPISWWKLVFLL